MPSPTAANHHRILRQVLELDLDPGVRGPELQEAVARSFWERVVPELVAVFVGAAGLDEILRLDRLEIDLGCFEVTDWEPQFRRRLVEQMARRLAQFRPVPETGNRAPEHGESQGPEPLRQFLFFLTHGRLPWWGPKPEKSWPEALLPRFDQAGWTALRQLLRVDPRTRLRLIDHASDTFLASAAEVFADLPETPRVLAHLTPGGLSAPSARQWRRASWTIVLDWVLADGFQSTRGSELVRDLLQLRDRFGGLVREGGGPSSRHGAPDRPDGTEDLSSLPQPWREWLKTTQASQRGSQPESARRYSRRTEPGPGEKRPLASDLSMECGAQLQGQREAPGQALGTTDARSLAPPFRRDVEGRPQFPTPRKDEAIYLEGAGAVILHPFLEELFRGRGLLARRDFRDGTARHRAVHLLGLLSFGREDVPEYELLLAKLLCGLPFEEPLEPTELVDDDRAACDTLLHAVLGHWTALRSGSPDWLRAQFFLREGKLEPVDFGWRLTVERRAQDVLLARLPWGLGVIGLPWMEGRLYVRWTD